MELAEKILNRLDIFKPQKKFLITLFTTILIARGKINFRNLSRYSHYSERTYTRQFDNPFNFIRFNRAIINECIDQDQNQDQDQDQDQDQASTRILALDASFLPKSGKKTYGLDHFWNGCHCRKEKGLEICWQDLSRFTYHHTKDHIAMYSLMLNHKSLKRNLKVVVLVNEKIQDKKNYVILFSTDTTLDAQTILKYYKARFQIEFIFRDAKQFTGLSDAQTRDQKRLDFHFNAALTTLNIAKAEHLQTWADTPTNPFSMGNIKACYFNTFFLEKFFAMFDLDLKRIKKSHKYQYLVNYGNIAA